MVRPDFHAERARLEYNDKQRSARQFGIRSLNDVALSALNLRFSDWRSNLTRMAVWGGYRLEYLASGRFAVVCGLKAGAVHLGYLDVIRECDFWASNGAELYFTPGIHGDGSHDEQATRAMLDTIKRLGYPSFTKMTTIDPFTAPWPHWEGTLASVISYRIVRRLFGWDENATMDTLRSAILTATAFLAPQLHAAQPIQTVIPCGLNEAPHVALAGYAAKKLGLLPPSATYRSYVPALDGTTRMSSGKPKTTIFVSDEPTDAEHKWRRAKTGGRPVAEQKILGGKALECPFMRAASSLMPESVTAVAVDACAKGQTCAECKTATIPILTRINRERGGHA